ncbi:MAG: Hsp20/alpha crystallin family protein [Drouetiella hepatica Uher 2000/2452]|jgi:HSP20 family protein|uniref:Hsp20/alpha crystallin family protein n=1 Tax=Drouetiella hepatica Uher 2000/2452 TaxID=904376 RepID=A0A951QCX9_9CYAN|nr:Hsp20/alpha crystallin family protein [Drouetiella hepatica Uher 2000/2452]
MIIRYWQPWREMETLRQQVDRLFDDLVENSDRPTWTPAIELKDTGDTFVLRAQIPGVDAKDVNVEVTKAAVSISGEHRYEPQNQENGQYRSEFRYGKFHRVVSLPAAVQNDRVQAEYKDGILNLTLPKVTEVLNKVVKINLAELHSVDDSKPSVDSPAPETSDSSTSASSDVSADAWNN